MSWSPSGGKGRSPGSSPESYRRRVDDFPRREEEFFNRRRTSPTFPRRIFKEVWTTETPNHRTFGDRPRMFKRVFRPSEWSEEFDDEPHLRRVEREMDPDFERRFRDHKDDPEFERRFHSPKDDPEFERRFHSPKDDPEFERRFHNPKSDTDEGGGRVHHIPIVVEHRREESAKPPPPKMEGEEYDGPPQVHRLRRAFEGGNEDPFARRGMFSRREPEWDPAAARTLPTRKGHKASQSFDDSRHPVNSKHVHRSHSETHAEPPQPHAPQSHSAAFRSHSDGHCPHQTFAPKKEPAAAEPPTEGSGRPSAEASGSSLGLQQIASVLQTAEDLRKTVEAYSGSGRDKQYRFLDEMLTRCMLRLDDVDTEGKEDVRAARKGAVREVQSCIDRLEAKANEGGRRPSRAERSPVEETNQLPKVIPLEGPSQPPKVIPLDGPSQPPKVIPLEAPSQPPKVIPLEGAREPPKVIPLGDVPRREPPISKDADEKKEDELQTKL